MYIKVGNDGVPHPYSLTELRTDNPNVSFVKVPNAATLAEYGVYEVTADPRPSADVVEFGDYYQEDGQWKHSWTSRDYTPEEYRPTMVVSMRQARLALHQEGKLSLVDDAIALIPEPDKTLISIEWEYASTVERLSPWISVMGPALGLDDDGLDNLFRLAATL